MAAISVRNLAWLNNINPKLSDIVNDLIAGINNNANSNQSIVENDIPSGTIDGTNATFTLSATPNPPGSLKLYKNGLRLTSGYTLNKNVISYSPGSIPSGTDTHVADYRR